jgi:hypothetical protein
MSARFGADADEVVIVHAGRPTGEERFNAMSRAEQDAALGPELAEAVRTGKVKWSELRHRDAEGRAEEPDVGDVV